MWKQFHTRAACIHSDTALLAKMKLEPVAGLEPVINSTRVLRKIARELAALTIPIRALGRAVIASLVAAKAPVQRALRYADSR
jgi:hypothetical protein